MKDFLGNGLGPRPVGDPSSAGLVVFPVEVFETPILDLTRTYTDIELVPAKPGFYPSIITGYWVMTEVAGTQSSPITVQAGQNATRDDYIASTSLPSNAEVAAAIGITPCLNAGLNQPASTLLKQVNIPVYMTVTVAAIGVGLTLKAKVVTTVRWFPYGGT